MKKILVLLVAAISLYANEASEIAKNLGYLNSYKEAIALGKKEHKLVMLVLVKDGCPWCKKLERRTLENKKIKSMIEPFVKVIIDKHAEMPKYFETPIVPVVYFVDPKTEQSVWEVAGYKDKNEFADDIDTAKQEFKSPDLAN